MILVSAQGAPLKEILRPAHLNRNQWFALECGLAGNLLC
jgi:hypothetical protein